MTHRRGRVASHRIQWDDPTSSYQSQPIIHIMIPYSMPHWLTKLNYKSIDRPLNG